jgi:hypothetical protein
MCQPTFQIPHFTGVTPFIGQGGVTPPKCALQIGIDRMEPFRTRGQVRRVIGMIRNIQYANSQLAGSRQKTT